MSEAPERIWAAPPTDDPRWESGAGEWDVSPHWAADGITEYIRADRIEKLEAKLAKAVDALLWCSGSADFNEGGVAREGWLKVCAPIIFAELKAMAELNARSEELTGGKDE